MCRYRDGEAHNWKGCLATIQCPVPKVHEDGGNAWGLVRQGVVVGAILLPLGIAQDLHVLLVGDVEMRPPRQPMLDSGEHRIREAPVSGTNASATEAWK